MNVMLAMNTPAVIKYLTLAIEIHKEVKFLPNIKSAEKRVLVGERNRLRNRIVKTGLKTAVKKFETAVASNAENTGAMFVQAASAVDKAASKGVIHKNAANRKKARLAKKMAKA
jgi:small subunit ribosomal protein S20